MDNSAYGCGGCRLVVGSKVERGYGAIAGDGEEGMRSASTHVRFTPAFQPWLSMGLFCETRSNPTNQLTDPTQPNPLQVEKYGPNPIHRTVELTV